MSNILIFAILSPMPHTYPLKYPTKFIVKRVFTIFHPPMLYGGFYVQVFARSHSANLYGCHVCVSVEDHVARRSRPSGFFTEHLSNLSIFLFLDCSIEEKRPVQLMYTFGRCTKSEGKVKISSKATTSTTTGLIWHASCVPSSLDTVNIKILEPKC